MKKKIALFHPWLKSKGGAEKVVLELLKDKENSVDVYTWIYDRKNTFREFESYNVKIIVPKIVKIFSRFYILRGLIFPFSLFSKIDLKKYDVLLISTAGMGEFITFRNYKKGKTYAYIHTILRASYRDDIKWNLQNRYKSFLSKEFYLLATKIYRILEKKAWKKIDYAIFNSELSLERAKRHRLLKKKAFTIIYPPIEVEELSKLKTKKGNYFLYVSRINNPKRQDLLLKAWRKFVKKNPKERLVLLGNIENKKFFEKIKLMVKRTRNVEIIINAPKEKLFELYANCKAVIFIPYKEDFGIVPFEALALGKPLIATNHGGFVKLIEKVPQYYKINEKESEEENIEEINDTLEEFLKSKIKTTKIKNLGNNTYKFKKRIKEILK